MRHGFIGLMAIGLGAMLAAPTFGDVIYNNLTPNNQMGVATRPDSGGSTEIEAGDDFFLGNSATINSASFVGLVVPGPTGGSFAVSQIVAEIYRVFPKDSDTTRTPQVPMRLNSPSDVAFASKDSVAGELVFATTELNPSLTVLNTVQPGGIHPNPNPTTGGDGQLTGQEIQFDLTFSTPFNLPSDHYFFVPQVVLSNGAQFYWLSASRPISGAGTTQFPLNVTDLQEWTRDEALAPDWLRVGKDIVGGDPAPTFNAAFSLNGTVVPEPATTFVVTAGLLLIGVARRVTANPKR